MSANPREAILGGMEEMRDVVAFYAGVKQLWVDAGFSSGAAEAAVIEMMRSANIVMSNAEQS